MTKVVGRCLKGDCGQELRGGGSMYREEAWLKGVVVIGLWGMATYRAEIRL